MQVARPRAGGQSKRNAIVERDEPGRVALPVHEERERRGEHRSVFQLAHRCPASIRHRSAHVEQQVTLQVGLFFVLLDVMPIASRVDLPVERGQIVARHVLAVLRELDAEALVRTSMQPREEPFDDRPRLQLHRAQPGNHGGIQEPQIARRRGRHDYIPLRGGGTASSRRSTRLSADTRSDSA